MLYLLLYILASALIGISIERYALARPFDSCRRRVIHAAFFAFMWPIVAVLICLALVASLFVGGKP